MSDANIVSIAITLFAIAAGATFNNVRISETGTALNRRIDDMRDLIRSENSRIDQKLDRIADTLRTVVDDHEQRLRSLEHRPR
jgi:hypothetical protein